MRKKEICLLTFVLFSPQYHTNHSTHGSVHSLDTDVVAGSPSDPYKDNLRRVQSTDSLGSSLSSQQALGGHNHKAKSASNLDESDFGPLVSADCGATDTSFGETTSVSSIKLTASHFLLTKDQEKAIKAMTPEQEETASLLSSISQAPDTAYLPPAGYRLVSDTEWNLLQQEVHSSSSNRPLIPLQGGSLVSILAVFFSLLWHLTGFPVLL